MERLPNRRRENVRKSLNSEEQLTLMKFRTLMQKERYSLRPMAKLIGISHNALSYILSGRRLPKASTVKFITEFLDSGIFPSTVSSIMKPRSKVNFEASSAHESQGCPFCGSASNKLQFRTEGDEIVYWITCSTCHARGPRSNDRSRACKQWARRSSVAPGEEHGPVTPGYISRLGDNTPDVRQ
jgi:Lar family restriction alleviation protein